MISQASFQIQKLCDWSKLHLLRSQDWLGRSTEDSSQLWVAGLSLRSGMQLCRPNHKALPSAIGKRGQRSAGARKRTTPHEYCRRQPALQVTGTAGVSPFNCVIVEESSAYMSTTCKGQSMAVSSTSKPTPARVLDPPSRNRHDCLDSFC